MNILNRGVVILSMIALLGSSLQKIDAAAYDPFKAYETENAYNQYNGYYSQDNDDNNCAGLAYQQGCFSSWCYPALAVGAIVIIGGVALALSTRHHGGHSSHNHFHAH